MVSDERLRPVLEAIGYELTMLVVAEHLVDLMRPRPVRQPEQGEVPWMSWAHNAQVEAHLLHMRNLFEFYYQHGLEVRAGDFVATWSKVRPSLIEELGVEHKTLHDYLSTRLSHITPEQEHRVQWPISRLTRFLIEVTELFYAHLDPRWRRVLREQTQFLDLGKDAPPSSSTRTDPGA